MADVARHGGRAKRKKAVEILRVIWAERKDPPDLKVEAEGNTAAIQGLLALYGFDLFPGAPESAKQTNRIVGASVLWEAIRMMRALLEHQMMLNASFQGLAARPGS